VTAESPLRDRVVALLKTIAPEIEVSELAFDKPLRNQVDLDSMDWLIFLTVLHEHLGVDIPETDYRRLLSLDALLAYLAAHLPEARETAGQRKPPP